MTHSFDTNLAKKVGIEAAIIYQHICFWVQHNEANGTNFINGHYWTYNSWDAWIELFPYMGKYTIKAALKKLKDANLITWETGINPENKWDKTAYYRVVDWSHFDIGKNQTSTNEKIEHHYRSDNNADINTPQTPQGAPVCDGDLEIEPAQENKTIQHDEKSKAHATLNLIKAECALLGSKGRITRSEFLDALKYAEKIDDIRGFVTAYKKHLADAGKYAKRLVNFMADYATGGDCKPKKPDWVEVM